jgi:hypothetical protein
MTDGRQSIVNNEQLINSLNSVLQNGHSRPPPEKMDTLHCDSEDGFKEVLSKVDQSKFQNCDNVDSNTEMHNSLDDKTIKNLSQLLDIDNLLRGVGRGLGEYFLGAGDGTVSFGVQVFCSVSLNKFSFLQTDSSAMSLFDKTSLFSK